MSCAHCLEELAQSKLTGDLRGCKGLIRGVKQVENMEQQSSLSMNTLELPVLI